MENAAKLITAISALLGAILWPSVLLAIAVLFRHELKQAAMRLPMLLDRVSKMKIAGIEAELERVADTTVSTGVEKGGAVTEDQPRTSVLIEAKSKEVGVEPLLAELDRLCLEYDAVRRAIPSGSVRTHAMTRILAKMRSLAPSVSRYIGDYRKSSSAGSRLAAVAIMQMVPHTVDIYWLGGRFAEDQPFIFYHAALALQNAMNHSPRSQEDEIKHIAEGALETVSSYDGVPDESTIMILQNIIDYRI